MAGVTAAGRFFTAGFVAARGIHEALFMSRRDDYESAAHVMRVSRYSCELACAAGIQAELAAEIGVAASFHDVGKTALPQLILLKDGPLTECERAVVETHTTIGGQMLRDESNSVFRLARTVALCHHERWDGTGYPARLKGSEIPLEGRIAAIADQYDALRSWRPYKPELSHERACDILLGGDDRTRPEHFDPVLLEVFRRNTDLFAAIYADCDDLTLLDWAVKGL